VPGYGWRPKHNFHFRVSGKQNVDGDRGDQTRCAVRMASNILLNGAGMRNWCSSALCDPSTTVHSGIGIPPTRGACRPRRWISAALAPTRVPRHGGGMKMIPYLSAASSENIASIQLPGVMQITSFAAAGPALWNP
jgi:hypothetical protein